MSDIAIRVEGLSKSYRIAHRQQRTRYKTLQEDLLALPGRLWSAASGRAGSQETFWALKDVSFDVKQGEVIGIIGRNGAGKSTLLKILSRITEPTTGRAEIYGRVGSLLEVGTGFHPELTGRENIYLNGAVLGMTRPEVRRKFDEIVDFADIEKFLDTPAKHYSSGMYMRLAFAVAAHLEPEILVVDEVLAVGDAEFQKKCLGKMGEVAREGRTVLFVSHNMAAILQLCPQTILLRQGTIALKDSSRFVVDDYLSEPSARFGFERDVRKRQPSGAFEIAACYVACGDGKNTSHLNFSQNWQVLIHSKSDGSHKNVQVAFEIWSAEYGCILCTTSRDVDDTLDRSIAGSQILTCEVPGRLVRPGNYWINVAASIPGLEMLDEIERATLFEIFDDGSPLSKLSQGRRGAVMPILQWDLTQMESAN